MARSLDSNIYGTDDNSFAQKVSSDALNTSGAKEDFWGAAFDQDARAKGNNPSIEDDTAKAKGGKESDSRAKAEGN